MAENETPQVQQQENQGEGAGPTQDSPQAQQQ